MQSILYAEFHPQQGPIVSFYHPSLPHVEIEYIIPKQNLFNRKITFQNISSCPIAINNDKYERNALIYNMACVSDLDVNKLGYLLERMEVCYEMLSKHDLVGFMRQVYEDINQYGETNVSMYNTSLHFKLKHYGTYTEVRDHHVPVLLAQVNSNDLTIQKLTSCINGVFHVKKLASVAKVDFDLAKKAIEHLIYFKVVKLVDIFKFSNVYRVTRKLRNILSNELAAKCCAFLGAQRSKFYIFNAYLALNNVPLSKVETDLDVRRLVSFGAIHGLIRRVYKYPYVPMRLMLSEIFNGTYSIEQICVKLSKSEAEVMAIIQDAVIINK